MTDEARFCAYCGGPLVAGMALCQQCGRPVAGQPTQGQATPEQPATGGVATPPASAAYPVTYEVEPQYADRNRLTVAFRLILAFPQWLLVGGPGSGVFGSLVPTGRLGFLTWPFNSGSGVIGLAAWAMAVVSWFAIVFTGKQPRGLWDFTNYFMRWRGNAVAYMALLRDEYPPFGPDDGSYPATFGVADFPETRDRWSVGLRLIYGIPQFIVLFFMGFAWAVTLIIGWFAILFTGRYPEGLYKFGVGYMRWSLRVQAYVLLMRDEYPPFSLR